MANISLDNIFEWPFKRQLIFFCLIFLSVFYIGYYLDLTSFSSAIANNLDQENDLKKQVKIIVNKEETAQKNILQFTQAETLLTEWKKRIIRYADLSKSLDSILKMGANNHLYFNIFTLNPSINENSYVKVPVRTIVTGNYHQIASFLSQIANSPWIVAIENMTITQPTEPAAGDQKPAEASNNKDLLTAEIMLAIYHLPESK